MSRTYVVNLLGRDNKGKLAVLVDHIDVRRGLKEACVVRNRRARMRNAKLCGDRTRHFALVHAFGTVTGTVVGDSALVSRREPQCTYRNVAIGEEFPFTVGPSHVIVDLIEF